MGYIPVLPAGGHLRLLLGLQAGLPAAYFVVVYKVRAGENFLWVHGVHYFFVVEKPLHQVELHILFD